MPHNIIKNAFIGCAIGLILNVTLFLSGAALLVASVFANVTQNNAILSFIFGVFLSPALIIGGIVPISSIIVVSFAVYASFGIIIGQIITRR